MIGLRRLKLSYNIYNFFQYQKLKHNIPLFRKLGLKKKYYSSISSKDFSSYDKTPIAADLANLRKSSAFRNLNASSQQSLLSFENDGFAILKNYIDPNIVDRINREVKDLIENKHVKFKYQNKKIMFAFQKSKLLASIGREENLSSILNFLLAGQAILFQSINFLHEGSEQKTHSDSFHMTTYPVGGLLGVWIALEDITIDNGPIHYYPKSHKLPYFMNEDFDNVGNSIFIGDKSYKAYEKGMENFIQNKRLEKKLFTAKKGDLLIWHANLLHGGEAHNNKEMTRKSMVFHYFRKDSICYHEISQRPAIISI